MVIVTSHLVYEEKCHPRWLCHMPGQIGCQRGELCSVLGSDGQDSSLAGWLPWQRDTGIAAHRYLMNVKIFS